MSIRRSAIMGDRVAVLQRAALQDSRLSYRARGILASVLSRPADWRTSAEQIANESPSEGRDAIRRALKELESCGYLVRRRVQGNRGHWETLWDISDEPLNPIVHAGHTEDGFPVVGCPAVGQPDVGSPDVGGPGLIQGVDTGSRDKPLSAPPADADVTPATDRQGQLPGMPDQPRQASPVHDLVGLYVDTVTAAGGVATSSHKAAIGKQVRRRLSEGIPVDRITHAVREAAVRGQKSIDPWLAAPEPRRSSSMAGSSRNDAAVSSIVARADLAREAESMGMDGADVLRYVRERLSGASCGQIWSGGQGMIGATQ